MKRAMLVIAALVVAIVSPSLAFAGDTIKLGGVSYEVLDGDSDEISPMDEDVPEPELIPEPSKTNLPKRLGWIGAGTFTAGYIPAGTKDADWTAFFVEAEKYWKVREGLRIGPAVSYEGFDGKTDANFDFTGRTLSFGLSALRESYDGITGSQTKLRLMLGRREDDGENTKSKYEMEQDTTLFKWYLSHVLYRDTDLAPFFDKTEFYAAGDLDVGHDKDSSLLVKGKRTPIPESKDPAETKTSSRFGVVTNIVRLGTYPTDVGIGAGVEFIASNEDSSTRWRPMAKISFFGEHLVVSPWYQFGNNAPDAKGVSVWVTVWSW